MEMNCPIHSVSIPGLDDPIELSGLIVVVGPNSSGKSQFLNDINEVVLGNKRDLVVLSSVKFNSAPDFSSYFDLLVQNRSIIQRDADNYTKWSFQFGTEQGGGSVHKGVAQNHHRQYAKDRAGKVVNASVPFNDFLKAFGPLSISSLFLKNRLTLMDTASNFDAEVNSPSTTLQALHLNSHAKERLQQEIAVTFNRGIWVDQIGRYGHLVVRVANGPEIPSADERFEPDKVRLYRGIESEGDGIRSYVAVCATLLLERRPLCLLDEPEMCLHPPQAYAMGRFIGRHVNAGTATVVSTHSSHVLRGILESNPHAHVIRLSRSKTNFSGRLLKPEALAEATSKPRSRAEAILEGLFAEAVIVCESDGDRIVYESTYRSLSGRQVDIRFVTAEGTGGFADPLKLYAALGVPPAIVADIDFLDKAGELKSVLTALGVQSDRVNSLGARAREAMRRVKAASSKEDTTSVINELRSIVDAPLGEPLDAHQLRGKLKRLSETLNPLAQLKKSGVAGISDTGAEDNPAVPGLRNELTSILEDLATHGLFLVPVGELESWLPVFMNGIARGDKGRWAMLAAEKIEAAGEHDDGVWEFFRSVSKYLTNRCRVAG